MLAVGSLTEAAQPASGSLSGAHDEVTWTGSPLARNPAFFATSVDPACDHFRLTINARSIKRVLIAITQADGFEGDDYALFVYDDQGALVPSQADGDGPTSATRERAGISIFTMPPP